MKTLLGQQWIDVNCNISGGKQPSFDARESDGARFIYHVEIQRQNESGVGLVMGTADTCYCLVSVTAYFIM